MKLYCPHCHKYTDQILDEEENKSLCKRCGRKHRVFDMRKLTETPISMKKMHLIPEVNLSSKAIRQMHDDNITMRFFKKRIGIR